MSGLREKIKNIPVIGSIFWWCYMTVKGPKKTAQLFSEVSRLSDKTAILESKIRNLSAGVQSADSQSANNKWAAFYAQEVTEVFMAENVKHHKCFMDAIVNYANKNSMKHVPRLLEIGVGTGTMSIYLSKTQSFDVVGLDYDPMVIAKSIESNDKLGGHAKFIRMDAYDIPLFLKEKSFDVAFSQGTMEHFNNDEIQKMLRAQLYAAEFVIFSVPSIKYPTEDYGNERRMSKEDWAVLLKNFGFKVELVDYYQKDIHVLCVISG